MLELYFDSKTRGSLKQTIIKSVLAGVYVAFGSFFFLTVRALPNSEVISALVFPLGLILCVLAGGNLFNIDCLAIGSKIPKFGSYLALAYIFNCMGALLAAYLIFLAGVEPEGAITLAANKNDLPLFLAFWRGIICNILIGVAAIVAFNTTNTFGKIAILTLPLACFITPMPSRVASPVYSSFPMVCFWGLTWLFGMWRLPLHLPLSAMLLVVL